MGETDRGDFDRDAAKSANIFRPEEAAVVVVIVVFIAAVVVFNAAIAAVVVVKLPAPPALL